MSPSLLARAERIRVCVTDVHDNGIDLLRSADRALSQFVARERDYFHGMLGYEPSDKEIVHLIRRVSPIATVDAAYVAMARLRSGRPRVSALAVRTIRVITPRVQRRLSHELVANPVSH